MFRKVAVATWRIIVAGAAFVAITLAVCVCWTAIQQPGHVGIRIILRVWWVDGDGLYDACLSCKKAKSEEGSLTAMSVMADFNNADGATCECCKKSRPRCSAGIAAH